MKPTLVLSVAGAARLVAASLAAGAIIGAELIASRPCHAQTVPCPEFAVDFGGTNQPGYTDENYIPLHWSNASINQGVSIDFSSGSVTIQKAGTYIFGGQTWVDQGIGSYYSPPVAVTKYFKNGSDMQGTAGHGCSGIGGEQFNGTSTMDHTCMDHANVGDVYQLQIYGTVAVAGGTFQVDGNKAHSYWYGVRVGP